MGRMENSNLDETRPTQVNAEDQQFHDLGTTRPVPTGEKPSTPISLGQTVPTSIEQESLQPLGLEDTIPPPGSLDTAADGDGDDIPPDQLTNLTQQPKKSRWRLWTLIGLLALILIGITSAFLGYNSGINQRKNAEAAQSAFSLEEQFQLGLEDMEAKRFDVARQRFEYIIRLDPNYPGVTEKLAETLLFLTSTATPTVAPTPTITPTPDLRGVDELFTQAQEDLSNFDWNAAIGTLLALRKADPNHQAVWVDDMLYISFRNRGADKILKESDLAGGIYDLTVAEQFGPLDADAKGYLTWASLYITGASFWELDWGQAVYYFGQVAPAFPNLADGSGWTAKERYRLALKGYGIYLAENLEWCDAKEQLELALELGDDPEIEDILEEVTDRCKGKKRDRPGSEPDTPTATPSDTPPPGGQPTPTDAPPTGEPPTAEPPTEEPPTPEPTTEPPPPEPTATEVPPTPEPTSTPEP
jgi:tetratricopeptide (TPR) repeat protein